jgi:hypothetical protein
MLVAGCGGGGGGSSAPPPTLLSLAVSPTTPSIPKGTSLQFTATGTFAGNTTQNVTGQVIWRSAIPSVATIGAFGTATAVGTGTTRITAVFGTFSSATTLTVTPALLAAIAITPANPSVAAGTTQQFAATGTLTDGTTQNLTTLATWSSQATSVATISNTAGANGLATAVGPGTTTIRAVSGTVSGFTVLTVTGGTLAANVVPITVNGSLCSSGSYPNKLCVQVTVCTPGTTTCQTVSDILLDTGSYGLRIFNQALTVPLTQVTVPGGNLAECIQFVDGTADWGPVKSANVVLGGEPAVTVPIQVIDATFSTVPAGCGTPEASPAVAGFNGVLGVGLFDQDCGPGCVTGANNGRYFACSGTSCSGTAVPLASQVQNPVAGLPVDNNGVLVQLPSVPLGGQPSVNGQLVLGIGTQTNNTLSTVTTYPASSTGSSFITIFSGNPASTEGFIDSGSNALFFSDSALPITINGWYIPSTTTALSAVNEGYTGVPSGTVPFQVGNATALFGSGNSVFVELGGSISGVSGFDWGLPFFYGRNVFVGIQGRSTSLGTGPFWAY